MYYVYILKHPSEDRIYIGFNRLAVQDEASSESTFRVARGLLRSLCFGSGR